MKRGADIKVAGTFCLVLTAILACQTQPPVGGQQSQPQSEQPRFDVAAKFTASGWMGDGQQGKKYIQLNEAWKTKPHSAPTAIQVVYSPGPNGWSGIYWQNKPDNWGDKPGENFSQAGFKKLTFWARGETGNEVIEFKAGGISAPGKKYKDSFDISTGKVQLDKDWKQYELSLDQKNLSSVIGGFCWVAAKSANPEVVTFYLDDIFYEP